MLVIFVIYSNNLNVIGTSRKRATMLQRSIKIKSKEKFKKKVARKSSLQAEGKGKKLFPRLECSGEGRGSNRSIRIEKE